MSKKRDGGETVGNAKYLIPGFSFFYEYTYIHILV